MVDGIRLDSINTALERLRRGEAVIVVDDEDRENEGDFVMAAEKVTPEAINFLSKQGRGLVCFSTTGERLRALDLRPMVERNTASLGTRFTVSVDAASGIGSGISAFDRARTVQVLIDPAAKPADLARPGHVFPLEAQRGGVLQRSGHTEAVVDLCRLAGLYPAGVICEIMNPDGSMFRKEANGLNELGKAKAIRVPKVILCGDDFILMEFIEEGSRSKTFFKDFGINFARLHQFKGEYFGFYEDNFIGSTIQKNIPDEKEKLNWIEFYFGKRILFQYKLAEKNGYASAELSSGIKKLEIKIEYILKGSEEPPSLLHGDERLPRPVRSSGQSHRVQHHADPFPGSEGLHRSPFRHGAPGQEGPGNQDDDRRRLREQARYLCLRVHCHPPCPQDP